MIRTSGRSSTARSSNFQGSKQPSGREIALLDQNIEALKYRAKVMSNS